MFTRDDGTDPAVATLALTGDIDMATAPSLWHLAADLPVRDLHRLTVDLGDVQFMDSTGVAFLVALRKRMAPGSVLVVANPASMVARVLQICGLASIIDIGSPTPPLSPAGAEHG